MWWVTYEARFWDENDVVTLVLAAPKAEPIFWLAEMKLWELEIEDQTDAPLAFADPTASPARLYAWLSCKFFKPCVMSSLNSRHAVMPRRRFKPWACASLEANTWKKKDNNSSKHIEHVLLTLISRHFWNLFKNNSLLWQLSSLFCVKSKQLKFYQFLSEKTSLLKKRKITQNGMLPSQNWRKSRQLPSKWLRGVSGTMS